MEQKNKIIAAVAIVAIVAALAAAYALSPGDSHRPGASAFPDPIQDGDRDYPPAAEAEARYAEAMASLEAALSDSSLDSDAMADEIQAAMSEFYTYADKFRWVELDYYMGRDVGAEYQAWSNLVPVMSDDLCSIVKDALSGPCASTVEAALRSMDEDPGKYRNYNVMSEEAKALIERETELEAEYRGIMDAEYSVTDPSGRTWTLSTVNESTTLTDEEKSALTAEICEAKLGDAAAVYVELVGVRNDYAVQIGYDDYAEYMYKSIYGREYTSSEAVKIVELAGKADRMSDDLMDMMGYTQEMLDDETAWLGSLDSEGLIDAVTPFIDSIDSDFARLLDYMDEYGLIYNCDEPGSLIAGYTDSLVTRGSALIYNGYLAFGGSSSTVLVHEFGHAANCCLVDGGSSNNDVREIHSQGLEALYCASGLVGNGSENAMACIFASNMLWAVSLSGIFTAFEVWAYEIESETGSLTVDQVLDRFGEIVDSTGFRVDRPYDVRYYWTEIPHLFDQPHYLVGYGTSGINAIELYLEAIDDYDGAKERYLALTYQSGVHGYVPAVEQAGLTNAFDIEASSKILDRFWEALGDLKDRSQ